MNSNAICRVFTSRVQNYSLLTNITTFDTHSATHLTKFNVYLPKGRSRIQTKRRGKLDFSRRNINMQLCLTYHLSEFGFSVRHEISEIDALFVGFQIFHAAADDCAGVD